MPTADRNFISLSIRELRPATAGSTLARGKFTTGGPIEQKPLLTDQAIYVVGSRWGLIKLRHGTLEPLWTDAGRTAASGPSRTRTWPASRASTAVTSTPWTAAATSW